MGALGETPLQRVVSVAHALFVLQFVALVFVSVRLFDHYHLGRDFSVYSQAWWLIAHGHLNPFSSPSGLSFVKNHFELIMWVLAPLYWVNHSAIDLLWIQDLSLVAAEVVVVHWAVDVVRRHPGAGFPAATGVAGVALLLLINPLLYATAFDDFHSEAIVVLFAVLTARDLYNGRNRRALVWTAGLLLCGDVAAIYVVALGISAMVTGRKSRLTGGILIVAGGVWLEIISALGANSGSGLTQRYGYLTNGLGPGQQASIVSIIRGMIDHPSRPWTVLHHQWPLIFDVMRPGGLIGVVSPWALFIAAFTLVPNALIPGTLFIQIGFQNLVVPLFAIIGSLMVVDWCARQDWLSNDRRYGQHTRSAAAKSGPVVGRAVAGVLAFAVVASSVAYAVPRLHQTYRGRLTVSPGTADMLDAASPRISANAEVIASAIVMGRFGDRPLLYQVWSDVATYPVARGVPIVFVLVLPPTNPDPTIDPEASSAGITADITGLRRNPHIRVLGISAGGAVLEWNPPAGVDTIALPPSGPDLSR